VELEFGLNRRTKMKSKEWIPIGIVMGGLFFLAIGMITVLPNFFKWLEASLIGGGAIWYLIQKVTK
jgi:hypothetical protein